MKEGLPSGYDEYDISMEDIIPREKYCNNNDKARIYQENDCR